MKHYIQYDAEIDSWALFRLFEGKRYRITGLSEEDLDTINYEYKIYKRNKESGRKLLDILISQEENGIQLIKDNFNNTEIGRKFIEEAIERLSYLKDLIINSKGESENDTDRDNVINDEGRDFCEDKGQEEGIGRSADDLYP